MATLGQWVNHDSPTFNKPAVDAMGQITVSAFEAAGANLVETHPRADYGDHYTLSYGEGDTQILTLLHFDTVWPMGEATSRPFTIADGRATGPGVHDMKGGNIITLFALKAIHELRLRPRHKLVFVLTSDEEIGSLSSRDLIEAEGRRSQFCFVPEGSHDRSRFTTARKGVGRFKLDITGVPAHSGAAFEQGVSAIEELARQIQALHALTDLSRGVTVNVGQVGGGDRPNMVARHAWADIDLRVTTIADGEALTAQILGLTPRNGCEINVTGGINRPPMEESAGNKALFEQARVIANDLGFDVESYYSGGGSDGNFVAAMGVPTLDGMGSLGGGAHAMHEYTVLAALPLRAALMATLMLQL